MPPSCSTRLTAGAVGHVPPSYTSFLSPGGLMGARIGVIRLPMDPKTDVTSDVFCFFVLLACAAVMTAFSQMAQVTGRVTDQSGAVVPDTQVTITNQKPGPDAQLGLEQRRQLHAAALAAGRTLLRWRAL